MSPTLPHAFPVPVADIFRPLWQEIQNIHFTWLLDRQLFGTSQERIEILNRFAGVVFGTFQRVLRHHVPLALFRLLDPASQRGRRDENLSLERLVQVVETDRPALGVEIRNQLNVIKGHMAPFDDLRNKVIAHNDLYTTPALFEGNSTVFGPSRQIIETVLADIRKFMNTVQLAYGAGESAFFGPWTHEPGDGETLFLKLAEWTAWKDATRATYGRGNS